MFFFFPPLTDVKSNCIKQMYVIILSGTEHIKLYLLIKQRSGWEQSCTALRKLSQMITETHRDK